MRILPELGQLRDSSGAGCPLENTRQFRIILLLLEFRQLGAFSGDRGTKENTQKFEMLQIFLEDANLGYIGKNVYVLHVRSSELKCSKHNSVDQLTDQGRVQRKLRTTYSVPRFPRSCLQSSKSLLTYTIIVLHFFIVPIIVIYHSKLGRPRATPSAKHLVLLNI